MAERPKYSHYDIVGPMALDVEIGIDDAERLRQLAQFGAPIGRNGLRIEDDFTDIRTKARASGLLSEASGDYKVSEVQFYAKTILGSNPDSWSTNIHFTKYRESQSDVKIAHRFQVSVLEDDVIAASHKTFIARDIARLAIRDDEPVIEHLAPRQYKMFERPITPEDIDSLEELTQRTVARAAISARRWNI